MSTLFPPRPARDEAALPPVRLLPCHATAAERRLARFPQHFAADQGRAVPVAEDQLHRFTQVMLLGECGDERLPRHSQFFDIVDGRDERVVGYVWTGGNNFGFGTTLYLRHLLIDPPYRRRGYATATLRAMQQLAAACSAVSGLALAVVPGNATAERLYRRVGFTDFARMMFLRTLAPGAIET